MHFIELFAWVVILNQHIEHSFFVDQRDLCSVVHWLLEVVFQNVVAKPLASLLFTVQQQSPCEGDEVQTTNTVTLVVLVDSIRRGARPACSRKLPAVRLRWLATNLRALDCLDHIEF